MRANKRSLFSGLLVTALTFALSFSGTAGIDAANAVVPCEAGWTATTINSLPYCEKSAAGAGTITFTAIAGLTSVYVEISGAQGGTGGRNDNVYNGVGGRGDVVSGDLNIPAGATVSLYGANAGGNGYQGSGNGICCAFASGGGGGGSALTGYAGASGGRDGSDGNGYTYGASGGGGGGASVIKVNAAVVAVAAGGGGGGGSDGGGPVGNYADGRAHVAGTNGTYGTGGGVSDPNDGAGGGGGGGGSVGGAGGVGGANSNGQGGAAGLSLAPADLTTTLATKTGNGSILVRYLNEIPAMVVSSAAPTSSGGIALGQTLTTAQTFGGIPAPTVSRTWEIADSATGPWVTISGQTASTLVLNSPSYVGKYIRENTTASNTTSTGNNSVTQASPAVGPIGLNLPGTPDLATASDSTPAGKTLTTDNITSDTTPTVSVASLVVGAQLVVTATNGGTTKTCTIATVANSTESCTFDGANTLSSGTWSFSATQSLNGQSAASASALAGVVIDTVLPTATSVTITPDLSVDKKVRISIVFSETLDSVDGAQILVGSSGVWTKSNVTLSGNTYSFDVTYTTLINDDISVGVGVTAATDVAGNIQAVARTFFEQVNTVAPSAVFANSTIRVGTSPTTSTVVLSFTRPVWGLTSADFSFPATNGAVCSLTSISPSSGPAADYTLTTNCTGSGTSTLRLAANTVKDFASVAGPTAAVDLTLIRDTTAPTITAISSSVVGSRVDYRVTFSEELLQFPANAISTAGATTATGTGTWTATAPARVGTTNEWTFSVSNADAINGVYKPSFTVGGNIKDLSGNALTADPTITAATLVRLPTFVVGTLASPSAAAIAIAPSFDLSLYSGKMYGIKITDLDWSTSGTTKDAFTASLSAGNMGGSVTTNTGNGTIEILAPNATEAQWETAIRSIQFDAGSNSGTRRFEFHLRPISGYLYGSEHYLVLSSGSSLLPAAITAAADSTYAGLRGYLATIVSAEEDAWSMTTGQAAWISGSDAAVEGTWVHTAGPEIGQTLSPTYWDNPPQQPDTAAEDCLIAYATGGYSGWHDVMCNLSEYYITEYGGMPGDPSVPSMKSTASTTVDAIGPDVTSVSALSANGTYIVGETINLRVSLDEATIVAGGTPRIKLNTSPTVRYATYVSGSGSSNLTFSYVVQAGDTAADLNYFDTASLELNGATLKDAAGNNATITLDAIGASTAVAATAAIVVDADLFIPADFALGTLPSIGPAAINLVPNFDVITRGTVTPFGIRITNNAYDASATTLDAFTLSPVPSGVTVVTNSNGVIELYGDTLTEAQWEAAIRAIKFDAGSSGAVPNFTFHLRPTKAYDYETGHAYLQFAGSSNTAADSKLAAATKSLAGFPGYIATPTTASENAILVTYGMTRAGTQMMVGLEKQTSGSTYVKTIAPADQLGNITYRNWSSGEPNLAGDLCVHMYGDGTWNDYNCNSGISWGYIAEFGGTTPSSNFLGTMVETVGFQSDLVGPVVTGVTAVTANGTLVAGDQVQIRVRFDEALTVAGSPRLSLNMGANTRTASCVAGTPATDLICSYTIVQGDTSADLSYASTTSLVLNGGSIQDAAGNSATLTLPAIGAVGSLSRNAALVVDGNLNVLRLSAPSATDNDRNLVFTLTSSLPTDCSTLSTLDGVDFNFIGIDSITSIVANGSNTTCTINAVSSVLAGQYGTSALTKASTFSADDLQSPAVATTALTVSGASIAVEVPAVAGQGVVNRRSIAGTPRSVLDKIAPTALFNALSTVAKNVLVASNILSAVNTAPIAEIEGDFSQATSRVDAKKKEQVLAGD